MDIMDWSEFWWTNITGSHLVVTEVVDSLMECTTVIIDIPADLPWRQQMRSAIEDDYRKKSGYSDMIIEIIDASDDVPDKMSPGHFLLDRYAPNKEVRNGYRERSQKTIQEYLIEKDVLKNRIIWVKGFSDDQAEEWINFCKNFGTDFSGNGSFVLEKQGSVHNQDGIRMRSVRLLECVSSYDVQLFNSFIVEDRARLSTEWKRYVSTVAASICDTDAEISFQLLDQIDIKKQSPLDVLADISNWEMYTRRGAARNSKHIFSFIRSGNPKELEHRLWAAQIKTLFPLIEMERIKIIKCYNDELERVLTSRRIEQFNEPVKNPFELELGTLCFIIDHYPNSINDKETQERIKFLRECRNQLAHVHFCNTDDVRELLDNPFRYQ